MLTYVALSVVVIVSWVVVTVLLLRSRGPADDVEGGGLLEAEAVGTGEAEEVGGAEEVSEAGEDGGAEEISEVSESEEVGGAEEVSEAGEDGGAEEISEVSESEEAGGAEEVSEAGEVGESGEVGGDLLDDDSLIAAAEEAVLSSFDGEGDPFSLVGYARELHLAGDLEGAADAYESVLLDEPSNEGTLIALIEIYRAIPEWVRLQRSLFMLSEVVDDVTRRRDLLLEAARIGVSELADQATSRAYYERVLAVDPECDEAQRALAVDAHSA